MTEQLSYRDRIQNAVTPAEELSIYKECINEHGVKIAADWLNPWSLWYEIDKPSGNLVDCE